MDGLRRLSVRFDNVGRLVAAEVIGADPRADRYWLTETGHDLYQRQMKRRGLVRLDCETLPLPYAPSADVTPQPRRCDLAHSITQYISTSTPQTESTHLGHSEF